ncbi:MAG: histidine phosphatase family protein, partial [Candidatus Limosilactobacillus intestinavium]
MSTNVYFIRHGETYFNCFARLQGWSDTPLT